jgi:drug/metabolite transporter (DMT)-like permease
MLLGVISLLIGQLLGNSIVPIGTKIASPFVGPILFVFFRFILATTVLFILFLASKKKKLKRYEYKDFILLGFLLLINVALFTIAISYTTVIMSSLIFSITPIFVGIGAHFFLQESFDRKKLVGLFISFVGLLFLLSQSFSTAQNNVFGQPLGNILIVFSMIGYSCYLIYSRRVLHKKDHFPIQTTFLTFSFTTVFLFIIVLVCLLFGKIDLKPMPNVEVWTTLIVGICSSFQYLAVQIGVKRTNAFTASIFQYTGPFIAASVTIPFLHEQVTPQLLIGGFLILFGVFVATTYKKIGRKFVK